METLLRIGLSNAAAALLLALVVVAVACVWRRPAVLHALWLVVLVKLLTPPLLWLPEPWTDSRPLAPRAAGDSRSESPTITAAVTEIPPTDAAPAESADPVPVPDLSQSGTATEDAVPDPLPVPVASRPAALAPSAAPWWVTALCVSWLAGAVAWYALALWRLGRFRRLLRHAVAAPESLRQRAKKLAEKMGLRRCPSVWLVPGRVAPMLWAAGGRPRVLFPADLLGRIGVEQQNALLVHELAHLRRRDHWVRWLEFVAAGLHWWNPVLWLARREMREAEEQCCDGWVTSTLPGAGKAYASALLETLDFLSDAPPAAPLLASGVGRVSDLKRRLTMIMRGTTPRALGWRGGLGVAGLGGLLLAVLPAWAQGQAPAKADGDKKPNEQLFTYGIGLIDTDANGREDAELVKAELKALEAQLAQKQAEVQDLAVKIQAVRAKLAASAERKPGSGPGERRIIVAVDGGVQNGALQDLLKKIQAGQPGGPNVRFIVVDKGSGKIIQKSGDDATPAPNDPVFIARMVGPQGNWVVVPQDRKQASPPAPDADQRIDELEMKLKAILGEVEQLRRERKPDGANQPHSYGPAPLNQIPYVKGLFRSSGPSAPEQQAQALAAEREVLQAKLAAVKANAEAKKSQGNADLEQVKAELEAAQAALKRAVVQHEKSPDSKEGEAQVNVRRAQLEQAMAALEKAAAENQAREAEIEANLKAAEADRQAVEAKLRQAEEDLRRQKEATGGDAPKKP